MRLKSLTRLFFSCALLSSATAFAWNATGHEVVARIAWDNLTPEAKAKVNEILRQHPDYSRALTRETTPAGEARDKEAFLIAATWPDLIRGPNFGKSHITYNHPIWHYVDIPFVVGDVKAPTDLGMNWTPGSDPQNAIQAIKKNFADLENPAVSPADRAAALAWTEHLIGDIHQPLHTTSLFSPQFPNGDQGGNSEIIEVGGRVDNLHYVWDSMLGGFMDLDAVEKIAEKIEQDHPRSEFEKELAVVDPEQWAREGHEEARHIVYLDGELKTASKRENRSRREPRSTTAPANTVNPATEPATFPASAPATEPITTVNNVPAPELPGYYLDTARGLAAHNAALAGYRLANALNSLYGKNP